MSGCALPIFGESALNIRVKSAALTTSVVLLAAITAGAEPSSNSPELPVDWPSARGRASRLPPVQPLTLLNQAPPASESAGHGTQAPPVVGDSVDAMRREMSELRRLVLELSEKREAAVGTSDGIQPTESLDGVAIRGLTPPDREEATSPDRIESAPRATPNAAEPTLLRPRRRLFGRPQLIAESLLGRIQRVNFESAVERQLGWDTATGPQIIPVQDTEQPSLLDSLQGNANANDDIGLTNPIFEPQSIESSLFSQLGRGEQRAAESASPSATGFDFSDQSVASIDTTQLTRESSSNTSISGIRRSQVAIQPVVRGYHQQQIYGQYQGANFIPVRFDLDSILSNIDPGIIDNLLIIPGPYGVKYGPGLAFIDVVPLPTPRHDVPTWNARTTVLYQTNGEQFYGRETISGGGPTYGARVAYGHKIGNDYQTGHGGRIPATYNVRDLDAIVGFDLNETSHLEFEYLRQDMTDTEFAGLTFDARIRKTDAFFFRFNNEDHLGADWLVEAWYNRTLFAGDNLAPSKQFFYRDNVFFNGDGIAPFPAVGFIGQTSADVTNSGGRVSPTWEGTDGSRLTLGADFHYVEQELDEFSLFAESDFNFSPPGEFDNFPIPRSQSIDPGAFAEFETPLNDALTLNAGARVDWVHTDAFSQHRAVDPNGMLPQIFNPDESVAVGGFEEVFGTNLDKNDVLYAVFVSADVSISEEVTAKLGFGHGERPPSLTERYAYIPFLTVVQSGTNFPFGDPDLRPERASQFDATLIGEYTDARIRVSGFYSQVDDYIAFGTFFFPDDPEPAVSFQNTDATIAGSEVSLEYFAGESWTPFGTMSYVHGRNRGKSEPLPSMYPLQSRLGIRFREPVRDEYGFELAARIVAGQNRVARTLDEPTTAGFTVYNVRGYWQVSDYLRLSAGIDNLTDKNYLEHLSIHDPAVLEPGFNFFMSAQIDH